MSDLVAYFGLSLPVLPALVVAPLLYVWVRA
jgi:hypothetical protein